MHYQERISYRYARGEALERETNLNYTFCAAFNCNINHKRSKRPGGRRNWTKVTAGYTPHRGRTGPQDRRWRPVQGAYRCSKTRSEAARYREGGAGGPIGMHTIATMPAGIGYIYQKMEKKHTWRLSKYSTKMTEKLEKNPLQGHIRP